MSKYSRRQFLRDSSLVAISVSPIVGGILLAGCEKKFKPEDFKSVKAFRLTIPETLLNGEFYFINCAQTKNKIYAKYSQDECYMVVRLPQQHIAEQSFTNAPNIKAASAISGYSYLTFRIVFNQGKSDTYISLKTNNDYIEILDWNNENKRKNYKFRLVVKKGHTQSLFEKYNKEYYYDTVINNQKTLADTIFETNDNSYPLNYDKSSNYQKDSLQIFDSSKYPKVDGQPITAIEAPWRLVLSPMLSDEKKYIFWWEFSKKPFESDNITYAELWMATLIIKDNPNYVAELNTADKERINSSDSAKVEDLQKKTKAIELMLVGTPDLKSINYDTTSHKYTPDIINDSIIVMADSNRVNLLDTTKVLPTPKDRSELVTLYIKYKLFAHTDKISFTPFGISEYIDFKNNDTETNGISLVSWKHLISIGRDEEVEVARLIMDKLFGHKMIHIYSTKRITEKGKSFLKSIEYIMPLEIEKDYSSHEDYAEVTNKNQKVSKFNFPFKKAVFIDKDAKKIKSLSDSQEKLEFIGGTDKQYIYIPELDNGSPVHFEYLVTDWDGNLFKVSKSIQAISYDLIDEKYTTPEPRYKHYNDKAEIINDFFNPPTDILSDIDQKLINNKKVATELVNLQEELKLNYNIEKISETINEIKRLATLPKTALTKVSELTQKYQDNLKQFKEKYASTDSAYIKVNNIQIDKTITESYINVQTAIESAFNVFQSTEFDSTTFLTGVDPVKLQGIKSSLDSFESSVEGAFDITQTGLQNKFLKIKSDIENDLNKYLWYDLFNINNVITGKGDELKKTISTLIQTADDLNAVINKIPGAINLYRNKIAFAVKDIEAIESENISRLETEFVAFKGKLKTNENNVIDFFYEFASVPQLDLAKVYVDKINKIVNDEIPLNIKYAEDYIKNQIDLTKMEVANNASKVFASIYENSREVVRTEMRKLSKDLGGIVNPELPVELLTALTHPKATEQVIINNLTENLPDGIKDTLETVRDYEKQMIFISEEAKNTFNDLKQFRFQPGDFFKALEAKILGSIRLKDILGIDFSIPNVTYLEKEKKIVYNFITDKLEEKDLGIIKFIPNANNNSGSEKTKIQVYADKSWDNANDYTSFSRLNNFAISIKPLGGDLLKVFFSEIKISSSSQKAKDVSVKIEDVKFDGVLNFLAVLAEKIKMPGTGIRVIPSFSGIEVGYSLPLPSITSPGFNFTNIKLDLALHIHFPTTQEIKPITISIGLNRPEDKFLISAGIYGGRGHFVLEATPNKIVSIDTAFEFGGVFVLDINIAKGQAFLMAGIRYQKDNLTGVVILTGYITCGGSMTVYGFITIGVLFIMLIEYNISDNTIVGEAAVSYSIKIGFFKKSFTLHYRKVMKGTERPPERPQATTASIFGSVGGSHSNQETDVKSFDKYYSEEEWEEYLNYFEIN